MARGTLAELRGQLRRMCHLGKGGGHAGEEDIVRAMTGWLNSVHRHSQGHRRIRSPADMIWTWACEQIPSCVAVTQNTCSCEMLPPHQVGGTPLCTQVACLASSSASRMGATAPHPVTPPPPWWWQPRTGLSVPRAHSGVVSAGGSLFVLGGRSQVWIRVWTEHLGKGMSPSGVR